MRRHEDEKESLAPLNEGSVISASSQIAVPLSTTLQRLAEGIPLLENELLRVDTLLFEESRPIKKSELMEERRRLQIKLEMARKGAASQEQIRKIVQDQHALFCARHHPDEREIIYLARRRNYTLESLKSNKDQFAEIVSDTAAIERARQLLREQDRYLGQYLEFQDGKHPRQKALEGLAKLERINFEPVEDLDNGVSLFARLMEDHRLAVIERALEAESLETRLTKERDAVKGELERERLLHGKTHTKVRDLEQAVARKKEELEELEQKFSEVEKRKAEQKEKQATRRADILKDVREIRKQEAERASRKESLFYDRQYGYLMLEGWRVLRIDLAAGIWPHGKETDHYFSLTIEELLKRDDFETVYFHERGQRAIDAVNRFLQGAGPYQQLLLEVSTCGISKETLEAWLVHFRTMQRSDYQSFCSGKHPRQGVLATLFREAHITSPIESQWSALWDETPDKFCG